MEELLVVLAILNIVLLIILLIRKPQDRSAAVERGVRDEIAKSREEMTNIGRQDREEVSRQFKSFSDSILSRMTDISTLQKNQLDSFSNQLASLTSVNEKKLESMRCTVEERLRALQEENTKKLEEMRVTVDEKLHATLEKRFSESFKLVSERLEKVYEGLGEMQTLAAGVGDLKRVLTNVKVRGIWSEVQLGNLLEQVLTIEQYAENVETKKGSGERVEFAIKLPGRDNNDKAVWLPIDAKFPMVSYEKLLEARDAGNIDEIKQLEQTMEKNIKFEARKIMEKYVDPPNTTDFAIMFFPVEGLYAEALRRPGLCESLHREFKILPTGPTTITALVNSLQMGFRTLAVEKRASEIWQILGTVKTEFGKFGGILDKTHKKLQEASNTIEDAARKSRTIERKLRDVQKLPSAETANLIKE